MIARLVRSVCALPRALGAFALMLALAWGVPVSAQTASPVTKPAASAEDCLKIAFDIAQQAEDKKLSTEAIEQVEAELMKLEGHCDNDQFAAAAILATDLKAFIARQ
jgi:hypothetical protein